MKPAAHSFTSSPSASFMAGVALCAASGSVLAQAPAGQPLWEIGGFALGVSQQAYPGADQRVNRVLAQAWVGTHAQRSLHAAGLPSQQVLVTPAPFSTLL